MTFVHEIATQLAHRKASLIDEHLARFLTEQGFKTTPWNAEAMREELKTKGFEVTHELTKYMESEVHTFKLVKVFGQTSLEIPMPHVTITP